MGMDLLEWNTGTGLLGLSYFPFLDKCLHLFLEEVYVFYLATVG